MDVFLFVGRSACVGGGVENSPTSCRYLSSTFRFQGRDVIVRSLRGSTADGWSVRDSSMRRRDYGFFYQYLHARPVSPECSTNCPLAVQRRIGKLSSTRAAVRNSVKNGSKIKGMNDAGKPARQRIKSGAAAMVHASDSVKLHQLGHPRQANNNVQCTGWLRLMPCVGRDCTRTKGLVRRHRSNVSRLVIQQLPGPSPTMRSMK